MFKIKEMALRLIVITMGLCVMNPTFIHAKDKECYQEIAVKNPEDNNGFGKHKGYSGDIRPSVNFPIVPRAIAIDSKGSIYVGDSVNYRVMKFDNKGKLLLQFKLQLPVKVIEPEISHIIYDIGIGKDDNVYVGNSLEARVEIYNQNGQFIESVQPKDKKIDGVFTKTSKGTARKYVYEFDSYIPNKRLPGKILYTISVFDVSSKKRRLVSTCKGVELDYDGDEIIYNYDYSGNIYTFDAYMNVIRINPFKYN